MQTFQLPLDPKEPEDSKIIWIPYQTQTYESKDIPIKAIKKVKLSKKQVNFKENNLDSTSQIKAAKNQAILE